MNHFDRDKLNTFEAKQGAQRIASAPFVFQAARALRDMGILAAVEAAGDEGPALKEIRERAGQSLYAVRVLAEAGLAVVEDIDGIGLGHTLTRVAKCD